MIERDYSVVNRKLSLLDKILVEAQHMLRTLTGQMPASRIAAATGRKAACRAVNANKSYWGGVRAGLISRSSFCGT